MNTDAARVTRMVKIYNTPAHNRGFFHLLRWTLLPSRERARLWGGSVARMVHHRAAGPWLTWPSPTGSHPETPHPVTLGSCPAGSPEAPRSWARSESLRRVSGPR